MKKLLVSLIAFFAISSFAQDSQGLPTRFEALNDSGGKIVLNFADCKSPNTGKKITGWRSTYTYSSTGTVLRGCWTYANGEVSVLWYNLEENIYPLSIFKPVF